MKGIILAGGAGSRLSILGEKRAKPAVPFGGKYRIIDFPLSNAVNSDLYRIAVLTQFRPHSLNQHIGIGDPWDLNRRWPNGIQTWQPYRGRRDQDWYRGSADAIARICFATSFVCSVVRARRATSRRRASSRSPDPGE